ncbi:hypothetical protein E1I69_13400 [Bacillus timonensis]|uniref:Uncharacterized protein n=1 Tax=Bacillus timonensis TaxID=1033734 RepID=A0A4S3PRH6_9BACI|nr:hypothetical protein [Bacillus timonensis]THE11875.1 hypothetical protein E1I69_13400 [Bacillus timonensis]
MEQETILKEILQAFKFYSEKIDSKLDMMKNDLESKMDNMKIELESNTDSGFAHVEERLDRLEKKQDGMRVELKENKETTDFLLNKTAQHKRKLHQLINQQL